jgi:hypothetical protein
VSPARSGSGVLAAIRGARSFRCRQRAPACPAGRVHPFRLRRAPVVVRGARRGASPGGSAILTSAPSGPGAPPAAVEVGGVRTRWTRWMRVVVTAQDRGRSRRCGSAALHVRVGRGDGGGPPRRCGGPAAAHAAVAEARQAGGTLRRPSTGTQFRCRSRRCATTVPAASTATRRVGVLWGAARTRPKGPPALGRRAAPRLRLVEQPVPESEAQQREVKRRGDRHRPTAQQERTAPMYPVPGVRSGVEVPRSPRS